MTPRKTARSVAPFMGSDLRLGPETYEMGPVDIPTEVAVPGT